METLTKQDRRTDYCGSICREKIGKRVCVCGWVQKQRDLGSLIFIDLRDRTGVVQLAFDENTDRTVFESAFKTRSEYVIMAKGTVRERSSVNTQMENGDVEIAVDAYKIISAAQTTPFEISDGIGVKDELRLKYRYLDLRRPALTRNILMRHEIARVTREYYYENGFIEIETPMLIRATPEGARDYLVPSRIHKGSFYALPQSPQLYKQLLMIAGYDRYIQLARCFRDEDLRADRQPEFTQIDIEMSFVSQEDIMNMNEGYVVRLFKEILGVEIKQPIPHLTYKDAMECYGTDKPDTRFGMEIQNISDIAKDSKFSVFSGAIASGGSVRAIVVKGAAGKLTRKEIDKLTEHAKGVGAKGLAYIRYCEDVPNCSFAKFLGEGETEAIMNKIGCQKGDVALIVADTDKTALQTLGALRMIIAKQLGIIPKNLYNFVWITEFPYFEWNEETQTWDAMHHPFTMPLEECLDKLDNDKGSVRATSFDLVLNGVELSSGSMRITDSELQQKMFTLLGLDKEEIETKFGFLVDAYRYGAPNHGGAALGLDRITMIMCGADSLRDVVAFPKVQNASELMSQCPSEANKTDLDALGIAVIKDDEK